MMLRQAALITVQAVLTYASEIISFHGALLKNEDEDEDEDEDEIVLVRVTRKPRRAETQRAQCFFMVIKRSKGERKLMVFTAKGRGLSLLCRTSDNRNTNSTDTVRLSPGSLPEKLSHSASWKLSDAHFRRCIVGRRKREGRVSKSGWHLTLRDETEPSMRQTYLS